MSRIEPEDKATSSGVAEVLSSPLSAHWKRAKSGFLYLIALMIGFGNWNDTKELSYTIFQGIQANFTHHVEERLLNKIDVGNYLAYVEQDLGFPQVVKRSRTKDGLEFRYYKKNKFLLTLLVKGGRISGYLVQTLDYQGLYSQLSAFSPAIPFSDKQLNLDSYTHSFSQSDKFQLDDFNLVYYMEPHPLGAKGMYTTLYLGTVEYGVAPGSLVERVREIAEKQVHGEASTQQINHLRDQLKPNMYGIGEGEEEVMAEALLTRYEYNTYF
ncbi:ETEC_3214 domain-containing protein [Ferrimonas futtsuensis]|uniref:ETEC_3214 domain-containing protein n=1 Tax=Ferrimonas futtsuensis TaxID=364764 RepID=UPI000485F270|nr:ETEC_3214 domain-containing protein [Ferrimonas futtsuensis]